jgi:hypothetical protein
MNSTAIVVNERTIDRPSCFVLLNHSKEIETNIILELLPWTPIDLTSPDIQRTDTIHFHHGTYVHLCATSRRTSMFKFAYE